MDFWQKGYGHIKIRKPRSVQPSKSKDNISYCKQPNFGILQLRWGGSHIVGILWEITLSRRLNSQLFHSQSFYQFSFVQICSDLLFKEDMQAIKQEGLHQMHAFINKLTAIQCLKLMTLNFEWDIKSGICQVVLRYAYSISYIGSVIICKMLQIHVRTPFEWLFWTSHKSNSLIFRIFE